MDDKTTDDALVAIHEARTKFGPIYLGGSRRMHELSGDSSWDRLLAAPTPPPDQNFGPSKEDILELMIIPITEATDYDFYATHTNELYTFLTEKGFEMSTIADADVDSWYDLDKEAVTILAMDNVQIVLRKDAEFYRAVFDQIEPWFYKKYLWKSSGEPTVVRSDIQLIMNMLFDIGRAAQKATPK